jgi:hypothetical protein
MTIRHTPAKVHWTFFIALEQDVEVTARYVEPVPANFNAFSLEMCRILFAAAAECEVVLKQILGLYGVDASRFNIDQLREQVPTKAPDILLEKVWVPRYGLELDPWANWRDGKNPDWWRSYNNVKHARELHYSEGNLHNALNTVAALMVAAVHFYQHQISGGGKLVAMRDVTAALSPESRLFFLDDSHYQRLLALD